MFCRIPNLITACGAGDPITVYSASTYIAIYGADNPIIVCDEKKNITVCGVYPITVCDADIPFAIRFKYTVEAAHLYHALV